MPPEEPAESPEAVRRGAINEAQLQARSAESSHTAFLREDTTETPDPAPEPPQDPEE